MSTSDRLSQNAAKAFLEAVTQAIHSIDETPQENRSSLKFVQILDAALEQIGQFYPDLENQERNELVQLAVELKKTIKSQPWVGFENLL